MNLPPGVGPGADPRAVGRLASMLAGFNLHPNRTKIETAVLKHGVGIVERCKDDPYLIPRVVPGIRFKDLDRHAAKVVGLKHPKRIRGGLWYLLDRGVKQEGKCWLTHEEIFFGMSDLMDVNREVVTAQAKALKEEGAIVTARFQGHGLVASKRTFSLMRTVCTALKRLGSPENPRALYSEGEARKIAESQPDLNEGQRLAFATALNHAGCLITGGAGSGKTYTIGHLTAFLRGRGKEVALCAPTGKAADRLNETLPPPSEETAASTIHRMLGCRGPGNWECNADNPYPADVVIVDEASMLDLEVAYRLLTGIRSGATVIFVGDANQLPPVGAGHIIRDILESDVLPIVRLEKIVRQAGILRVNSSAILERRVEPSVEPTDTGDHDSFTPWTFYQDPTARKLGEKLIEFLDTEAEAQGFDPLVDVQVLTPTHKGPMGDWYLNLRLQQFFQNKDQGQKLDPPSLPDRRPRYRFMVGDKVIHEKNNYSLGVMNGTVGTVIKSDGRGLTVEFRDGHVVEYTPKDAFELALAYALTIHKSQGSEFPCAVVIIHSSQSPKLHYQNLLYTAVTRAQKAVLLLADNSVRLAAMTVRNRERRSLPLPWKDLELEKEEENGKI